jgi:hypothetical protein
MNIYRQILNLMSAVSTYEMLDGRMVTVDFCDYKSLMKVKKKDWIVIRTIIREQLKLVQHPAYIEILKHNFKKSGLML